MKIRVAAPCGGSIGSLGAHIFLSIRNELSFDHQSSTKGGHEGSLVEAGVSERKIHEKTAAKTRI